MTATLLPSGLEAASRHGKFYRLKEALEKRLKLIDGQELAEGEELF